MAEDSLRAIPDENSILHRVHMLGLEMTGRGNHEAIESNDDDDDDDVSSEDDEYSEYDNSSESDAQQEWEESLRQLEQLFTWIIIPVAGKFFGRRFAYYCEFISIRFYIIYLR